MILQSVISDDRQVLTRGHTGAINDLLWMPDKRTLATAGSDGAVVLWDLQQQEIRLKLLGHAGAVRVLAFDHAGNILYSGGDDGRIQAWVAASAEAVQQRGQSSKLVPEPKVTNAEKRAAPSEATRINRSAIDWLLSRRMPFQISSFGILQSLPPEKIDLGQVEEIAVHTISMADRQELVDEDLSILSGLTELRVLDLADCNLSSLGISKLRGLSGLHTLVLSGIDLSDFDFQILQDLVHLQKLQLNRCGLSDEQLILITQLFPQLRELEVSHSRISSVALSQIDRLKHLTSLKLNSTSIDDEALAAIGHLNKLQKLDLSETNLSGGNLLPIKSLKILKELSLKGIPVTDGGLQLCSELELLQKMDLRDSAVTGEGISGLLNKHPALELRVTPQLFDQYSQLEALLELGPIRGEVVIDGQVIPASAAIRLLQAGGSITGLTWPVDKLHAAEDLPFLAKLPKLTWIRVSPDAISHDHFPLLARILGLQSLDLSQVKTYSSQDLDFIGKIESLQSLTFTDLKEGDLKRLQNLKAIESLEFSRGATIDQVASVFPKLKHLSCNTLDLMTLNKAMPNLSSLESLSVKTVPNRSVWPVLAQLKKLKRLEIKAFINVQQLEMLRAMLSDVQVEIKK